MGLRARGSLYEDTVVSYSACDFFLKMNFFACNFFLEMNFSRGLCHRLTAKALGLRVDLNAALLEESRFSSQKNNSFLDRGGGEIDNWGEKCPYLLIRGLAVSLISIFFSIYKHQFSNMCLSPISDFEIEL